MAVDRGTTLFDNIKSMVYIVHSFLITGEYPDQFLSGTPRWVQIHHTVNLAANDLLSRTLIISY